MMDALFDKLGITAANVDSGTTTTIVRLINESKDRFINQQKWAFLESSNDQLWTTDQRFYTAAAAVSHIVGLELAAGTPLEKTERQTYDELFRAATDTATAPSRYVEEGTDATRAIAFHVWPVPTTNTTGKKHYLVRVPDIANAASTGIYEHIPENHHFAIVQLAEAAFAQFEDSDAVQVVSAQADRETGELGAAQPSPVLDDGTI